MTIKFGSPQHRARIMRGVKRMKRNIELELNTIRHWNERVRKPHEELIDPDQDGFYAQTLAGCDRVIALEHEDGPLPMIFPFATSPERPQ